MSQTSHFEFVDSLPEDSVRITGYRSHTFESLYYSPSNAEFYQAPKVKYRKLVHGKTSFRCRSDNSQIVKISLKKLKKQLESEQES